MKKLRTFAHHSESQLAKALLASHGIDSQILGPTLLVPEDDFNHAHKIIEKVMAKDMMLGKPAGSVSYLRKAILFALGAPFLLPVVFNGYSLYYAWKYWENSDKQFSDQLKVGLVILLQVPTYFALKITFNMLGDLGSTLLPSPDEGVDL